MGPIPKSLGTVVLLGCCITGVAVAGARKIECNGPYKGSTPTPREIETVLRDHQEWLKSGGGQRVKPCHEELQKAGLRYTNLQQADLQYADLQGADLRWADFREADLRWADLRGTDLRCADLRRANLFSADLEEANFWDADLRRVYLDRANVHKADFGGANLQRALYEPKPGELPSYWTLAHERNRLDTLVFYYSPAGLMALREAFKKGGMRTQERQLTYAIESTQQLLAWDPRIIARRYPALQFPNVAKLEDSRSWWKKFKGTGAFRFNFILFELPSGYGMAPNHALIGLGILIALFSFPYMVGITTPGPAGIWMVWLPDRVHKAEGEVPPTRVTDTFLFSLKTWGASRWRRRCARWVNVLCTGLYFSLLSAFSLGWRELNVGTWIARLQPREYILRPTGWVRTVAGIQSLLSVYLLALWVLTYFGRPFE
jgi:hypothetical protein